MLSGSGLGLAACFQLVPSQCRTRVETATFWVLLMKSPTAQTSPPDVAVTLVSSLLAPGPGPGLGLGFWVQLVPSQCRVRVAVPVSVVYVPTAQASLAEIS